MHDNFTHLKDTHIKEPNNVQLLLASNSATFRGVLVTKLYWVVLIQRVLLPLQ